MNERLLALATALEDAMDRVQMYGPADRVRFLVQQICAAVRAGAALPPQPETEVQIAERIARGAHAGQVDKAGEPYIQHVERVVAMVDGDQAKAVAWLHDVIEDCDEWSGDDLLREGISVAVVDAVWALTRSPLGTYEEYIGGILVGGDALARAVKVADLKDHLRANCPLSLRPRYEKALQVLEPTESLPLLGAWRDISTAPKDGTLIVVRFKNDFHEPEVAKFVDGHWRTSDYEALWTPQSWMPLPLSSPPLAGGA